MVTEIPIGGNGWPEPTVEEAKMAPPIAAAIVTSMPAMVFAPDAADHGAGYIREPQPQEWSPAWCSSGSCSCCRGWWSQCREGGSGAVIGDARDHQDEWV